MHHAFKKSRPFRYIKILILFLLAALVALNVVPAEAQFSMRPVTPPTPFKAFFSLRGLSQDGLRSFFTVLIAAIAIVLNIYGIYRWLKPAAPRHHKTFLLITLLLVIAGFVAMEVYVVDRTRLLSNSHFKLQWPFDGGLDWLLLIKRVLVAGIFCSAAYGVYRLVMRGSESVRKYIAFSIGFIFAAGLIAGQILNSTGFCFAEGRYLSNRDILDRQRISGSGLNWNRGDLAKRDAAIRVARFLSPNHARIIGPANEWGFFDSIWRGLRWEFNYESLVFETELKNGERVFFQKKATGTNACGFGFGDRLGKQETITEEEYKAAIEVNKELLGDDYDRPPAGQNLAGLEFINADFKGVSFRSSDLRNTSFRLSHLEGADFTDADLRGASFYHRYGHYAETTDISGADFSKAKITDVVWQGTIFDCKTKFPEGFNPADHSMIPKEKSCVGKPANKDYSRLALLYPPDRHYRLMEEMPAFMGVDMENANFEGAKNFLFDDVNLKGADFSFAHGRGDFIGVDLTNADFSNSSIKDNRYSLQGKPPSKLTGAKFRCAHMPGFIRSSADIEDADLTGAIFGSANVRTWPEWWKFNPIEKKVVFWDMNDVIKKFGPADYTGMDLTGCDLMYYNFGTTNLSNAIFKAANLETTQLTEANLTGANFDGARLSQRTKFPEGFDLTKHKFIPTSRLNETSSPWRASDKGLENHLVEMYKPPDFPIPDFPDWDFGRLDYTAAWLPGSNMQGAKMRFTDWSASNLEKTNLSNVDATGAIFYDTVLNGADLTAANLYGADLRRANLSGAKLDKTILTNSIYNHYTVWPEGFDAKQSGAYFSDLCESPWGGPCQQSKSGAQCRCPYQ